MTFVQAEIDILVYWMTERDAIRQRKESGEPRPWTADILLRDYRWCNVRRVDDAVSRAMVERWYRQEAEPLTALTAACLGRLINWPDSLMAITGGQAFQLGHLDEAQQRLVERANMGKKVFTGAYVVPGRPNESKIKTVIDQARGISTYAFAHFNQSMKSTWAELTRIDGLGSFLAGQMVADLAHLDAGKLWPDRTSWAPLGPGSMRGINRVLGRPKDQVVSQPQFEQELPALMEALRVRVPDLWVERGLHAMDFQNCLCEFDKLRRLQLGEGKVRSGYEGREDIQDCIVLTVELMK